MLGGCHVPDNLPVVRVLQNKKRRCDYSHSGGGEGEVLTLSKLANRSTSRRLCRGGEEGAKGSAKGSLAGREEEEEEEEEKSPEVCWRKGPRRWKDSEDSVLEIDDRLPDEAKRGKHTVFFKKK